MDNSNYHEMLDCEVNANKAAEMSKRKVMF